MSIRHETPAIPTPRTRPVPDETGTATAHPLSGTETTKSPASGGASCALGHSPVGGAPSTRSCAPGVAQDTGRQAATGTGCGPEGGPAPKTAPTRTRPQRRSRTRQNKQRDAVSVRLSTTERAQVKAAADHTGASLAKFMAQASLAAAHDINRVAANLLDLRGTIRELIAARTDLARIGNNINQIARAINSGGDPIGAEAALADVRRVAARLEAAAQTLADRA
ncbi:MobC family plasmid mobilization relaxosome protein [Streptomyces sp. NPDC049040]|uniref:MobC family plasmid mobilization relaxosome protein n=1 Tax=Streptomyces sp. NPDC049040 TaxID=3365593 RepID=UPI00371F7C5F